MAVTRVNNHKIHLTKEQKQGKCLERDLSLSIYYGDIRHYKPLSEDEINELFDLYKNGSERERKRAEDTLFKTNARLVITLARNYCREFESLSDYIQEGNIGLINAMEKYIPNKGGNASFTTYAVYYIRAAINQYRLKTSLQVQKSNWIKTNYLIKKIKNELTQKLEREPQPIEIMDEYNKRTTGAPINNEQDVINIEYLSVDEMNPSTNFGEEVPYQEKVRFFELSNHENEYIKKIETEDREEMTKTLLKRLTEKEKSVVIRIYGLDGKPKENATEIAYRTGYTKERIGQIHRGAIAKLKKFATVSHIL